MKGHVTAIPADKIIIVDGAALQCAFTTEASLHALQWHCGKGHVEYSDGTPNRVIAPEEYQERVAPLVTVWETEKARLAAEANKLPALDEAREMALAALKEKRLLLEYGGPLLVVDGVELRFPSDVKDETRLNSLAGLFLADPALAIPDWKVADGVYVTMTAPLLQQVKAAGFAHIAATFSVERAKREQVLALNEAQAVLDWMKTELHTGWAE